MADIKTREVIKGTIKTLDRAAIASQRLKEAAIKTKRGAEEAYSSSDGSPSNYAISKAQGTSGGAAYIAKDKVSVMGRKSTDITKQNIVEGIKTRKEAKATAAYKADFVNRKSYRQGRKLAKSRYAASKPVNKVSGSKKKEAKTIKSVITGFLKSVRRITEGTKVLIIGLGAAGWIATLMILVCIFVGGTMNLIDVISVDPNQPGMNEWDKKYAEEILAEYPNGYIGPGDGNIVNVALSQVGNVGGRRYWYWYGFRSHVAWCACFVSWCADQCGYIKAGIIPKFAGVAQGVHWFQKKGEWHGRNYRPKGGDIIFFTWFPYTGIDHVGIVKACDGKRVYTVEGNSGDKCREKSYSVGAWCIYGYGSPKYDKPTSN